MGEYTGNFTSDHGDMDSSHRMEHKSTLYQEAIKIPFIICSPDISEPGQSDDTHLISNGLDILPTICDYSALSVSGLKGFSLKPIIEDRKNIVWRDYLGVESAVGRAIITERYKYAVYDLGKKEIQLMNLKNNPGEMKSSDKKVSGLQEKFQEFFGTEERDVPLLLDSLIYA
ncbi:MAG: hypothetical protein N2115_05250 [bacterium]|nr:hypothetical protein [bacterium]